MGSNLFSNLLLFNIFLSSTLNRVRLRIRISDLLVYIMYFIVTVIVRLYSVRQTWRLVVGIACQLLARYTRRNFNSLCNVYYSMYCVNSFADVHTTGAMSGLHWC